MLFMVVERFKSGDPAAVGDRFAAQGRLLPEGVEYQSSWMTQDGTCCYQLMGAPDRGRLDEWIERWSDLVDFEVTPVVTSAEFWASHG